MIKQKNIKDHQKETLFLELKSLLSSGLSFGRTFELLIQTEKNETLKTLLSNIFNDIINGNSLWSSMQKTNVFTPLDYGVIRIGEETGKLENSLLFLAEYYKKKIIQKRIIVNALSYPLIIMTTALFVLFFMIVVVVPMFEQVYSRMGSELPWMTRVIVNLSSQIDIIGLILTFICGSFFIIHILYKDSDKYKKTTSNLLLRIPIIGEIIKKHYEGQFCKLMFLLYGSGIPILNGVQLIKEIIIFYPFRNSFLDIESNIKNGYSLSHGLKIHSNIYSIKLITLINVGEETNKMADVLSKQSDDISAELEHKLKQFGSILEPVLILFIGTIVALILISMYMPMFKLGGTIY